MRSKRGVVGIDCSAWGFPLSLSLSLSDKKYEGGSVLRKSVEASTTYLKDGPGRSRRDDYQCARMSPSRSDDEIRII